MQLFTLNYTVSHCIILISSIQFAYFLTFLASLTCALVLAAEKPDPRKYDTPVDVFRGLCEAFALLTVGYTTLGELNQMRM